MINEKLKLSGKVKVTLLDEHNKIKAQFEQDNLVVTTGLTLTASRLLSNSDNVPSHMAIGSGLTAPVVGNTTLETELGRVVFDSATNTLNVITYIATFPAGTGTGVVAEAGIFNDVSAGTMLNRVTFGTVTKGVLDTMIITWTLTIG